MRGFCRFVGDAMWGQGETARNLTQRKKNGEKGGPGYHLVDGRGSASRFHD
jgi:hypothetical protein